MERLKQVDTVLQSADFGEDRLVLEYSENIHYAGYQPANLFVVYYLERAAHLDEDGRKAYNTVNTEHFLSNDFETAFKHYNQRRVSKHPAKAIRTPFHLSMILTKEGFHNTSMRG